MRKLVVLLCALTVLAAGVFAQPAEKAAAASATTFVMRSAPPPPDGSLGPWIPILTTTIKPPGGKDLFIGVSAQTGVFTTGSATTGAPFASEGAGIVIRVLVDGSVATPGLVVFNSLFRSASATLTGTIASLPCTESDIGPNAGKVICTGVPVAETLRTVLNETVATTFNFIKQDVSPGAAHTVTVQARFTASKVPALISQGAVAVIGPRTLTVEQVALDAQ